MALSPTSSRGGASPYQTGAGSPAGAVTPTSVGGLYIDTTNGALYIAVGATNASWVAIGGDSFNDGSVTGVISNEGVIQVLTKDGTVALTDVNAFDGTGNALYYLTLGVDGDQFIYFQLGSTGQFTHRWAADGSYAAANGIKTGRQTSAALPTVALVSATAARIDTISDRETHTPVTFNPGVATTATCVVELSPDNVTFSTLAVATKPVGTVFDGTIEDIAVRVPAGWYLRLTVTNATLGTTTYY